MGEAHERPKAHGEGSDIFVNLPANRGFLKTDYISLLYLAAASISFILKNWYNKFDEGSCP